MLDISVKTAWENVVFESAQKNGLHLVQVNKSKGTRSRSYCVLAIVGGRITEVTKAICNITGYKYSDNHEALVFKALQTSPTVEIAEKLGIPQSSVTR